MSGFAALTSTLMISIVLSLLAILASSDSLKARVELSQEEAYLSAERTANSCGLLSVKIARNYPDQISADDRRHMLTQKESCAVRTKGGMGVEVRGWRGTSTSYKTIELGGPGELPVVWKNTEI